jgi:microcystin-dependent protein
MDGYIGEVKMFAGPYAPKNWFFCQGQTLSISQYNSLYAIIGTTYGGDGISNFNLPDLCGRAPVSAGSGQGLTARSIGQTGGAESVILSTANLPQHMHNVKCNVNGTPASTPVGNVPSLTSNGNAYSSIPAGTADMNTNMAANAGGSLPHQNMPPWTCINYIINVYGMWPPRS